MNFNELLQCLQWALGGIYPAQVIFMIAVQLFVAWLYTQG